MVRYKELKQLIYAKVRELHEAIYPENHDKKHVIGVYYPVDAWRCKRQVFFKYKFNVSSDIHERAMGRIVMSNLFEKMYLEQLQKMGYSTHVKFERTYKDILVRGEVDAINREEVIEIKTVTPTLINKIPFARDIMQLNVYMWLSGRNKGSLIYIKSDNPAIFKVYEYDYRPEYTVEGLENLREIHKYLLKNEVPPKTTNTSLCKTCIFREVCEKLDLLEARKYGQGNQNQPQQPSSQP